MCYAACLPYYAQWKLGFGVVSADATPTLDRLSLRPICLPITRRQHFCETQETGLLPRTEVFMLDRCLQFLLPRAEVFMLDRCLQFLLPRPAEVFMLDRCLQFLLPRPAEVFMLVRCLQFLLPRPAELSPGDASITCRPHLEIIESFVTKIPARRPLMYQIKLTGIQHFAFRPPWHDESLGQ
jgi:hypothetical protein